MRTVPRWRKTGASPSSSFTLFALGLIMVGSHHVLLLAAVALALGLIAVSPAAADDLWGSTALSDWFVSASGLHVTVFDYRGDTGLQVTALSSQIFQRWGQSLKVGLGYDDMVFTAKSHLDGSPSPLAISDRLFLLHTPCDKRFQFTLQITW